ncbi:MAG: CorA family divalent cation transporter [Eubacteriales bacterium]|nr:CorA family divalent cation transporter [Eubacteriales bacterium]
MYYALQPQLHEISLQEANEDILTVGYIETGELTEAIQRFRFYETSAEDCVNERDNYRNAVEVYEDYTFGMINIVDAKNVYASTDRLAFFFRKNLLLVVSLRDEDGSTRQTFLDTIRRYKPETVTLERLIFSILESTIRRDSIELDLMEKHINALEDLVDSRQDEKAISGCIYDLKKKLLILRSYYEQIIDIGEALSENENDIFEEEALHFFALLSQKAERLSGSVSMLCDELNQLRDAFQSSLDYRLNQTMKLLAIITTLCLPMSLIVGWYGMNFNNMFLPNTGYGYPLIIGVCVIVVTTLMVIFKRKGLL